MDVLDPRRLELGEGPGYDPVSDTAWWFDIEGRTVCLYEFATERAAWHSLPLAGSALAVMEDGSKIVAAEDGLYRFSPLDDAFDLYLPIEAHDRDTRSNDARVHPSGAFWVSTMSWSSAVGAGSIYRVFGGKAERLWADLTIPNAICFSPCGRTGYFTDTRDGRILRVALDPADGRPLNRPEVFLSSTGGNPDGAVTDALGNLWIAIFGAGTILGFTPEGRYLRSIEVGVANVTCPAFVGRDARRMLATTALFGLSEQERQCQSGAGMTYWTALPFAGRADPPMRG